MRSWISGCVQRENDCIFIRRLLLPEKRLFGFVDVSVFESFGKVLIANLLVTTNIREFVSELLMLLYTRSFNKIIYVNLTDDAHNMYL